LCLYLRELESLARRGVEKVSSRQMARDLHVTDAQVRKDLAYFGQFGRPGVGYRVEPLREELRRILGTDHPWNVIVVGAGDLGRALLRYRGFRRKGFHIVAAFDIANSKVGRKVGSVPVHHMEEMPRIVREQDVKLAVVAVPAESAQEVTDALCGAGVRGILNFAPATLETPEGVAVGPVDLAAHLEQLSFQAGRDKQ
jgi:redox-sensing transcriptional repressor